MRVGPLLVLAGGGRTFCEVSSSADVDDVLCCCELDLGSSALKISKRSHHLLSSIKTTQRNRIALLKAKAYFPSVHR